MKTTSDNFEGTCGDYTQVSNCIDYFCNLAGEMAIKYFLHRKDADFSFQNKTFINE